MIKNYKIENNDEGKNSECLDETSPDKMEDDVSDRKNENNEKSDEKKS